MSAKQPKYRLVNNKIIVALCLNLLSPGGFGSKILGTDNLSGCIVMVDRLDKYSTQFYRNSESL